MVIYHCFVNALHWVYALLFQDNIEFRAHRARLHTEDLLLIL